MEIVTKDVLVLSREYHLALDGKGKFRTACDYYKTAKATPSSDALKWYIKHDLTQRRPCGRCLCQMAASIRNTHPAMTPPISDRIYRDGTKADCSSRSRPLRIGTTCSRI